MKRTGTYTPAKLLLLAELLALLIGVVTPVTPSKTGATRGMAHLFFTEPSYLQQVLVNFLVVNLLMAIIAIIVVAVVRREGGR
jgi:hypothetical protein